jgi:hypothetical protein
VHAHRGLTTGSGNVSVLDETVVLCLTPRREKPHIIIKVVKQFHE